jgi:hypothetical protein
LPVHVAVNALGFAWSLVATVVIVALAVAIVGSDAFEESGWSNGWLRERSGDRA